MAKKNRPMNCVIFSRWNAPGVIWRWYRMFWFRRLSRRIERLPGLVRKMGHEYRDDDRRIIVD